VSDNATPDVVRRDPRPIEAVFERYHAAWESKDPDAIVALHSDDSTFVLRAGQDRVLGRGALREHFAAIFADYPDYRADVQRILLGERHWVLEWTMVVDLPDPGGEVFTARIDLLDVVDVGADGKIVRKDVYVDGAQQMAAMRRAGRT
jgi:uncharacterized protein (TIGR02246 family)